MQGSALTSYHVDMSEDIKLNDLLHLTDEEISRMKIRFMTNYNGTEPIKVFRRDPDELNTDWLLSRKRNDNGKDAEHLHKGENVIGLVRLPENNDLWGLTCLKRIGDPLECPKEKSEDDDPPLCRLRGRGTDRIPQILRQSHRALSQGHTTAHTVCRRTFRQSHRRESPILCRIPIVTPS